MSKKITLATIKKELHSLDPKLPETDDAYKVGLILLSALQVGAKQKAVADFTGLPISFVQPVAARLRKNKVWVNGITRGDWFSKDGGIAFWLDVGIGQGYFERA